MKFEKNSPFKRVPSWLSSYPLSEDPDLSLPCSLSLLQTHNNSGMIFKPAFSSDVVWRGGLGLGPTPFSVQDFVSWHILGGQPELLDVGLGEHSWIKAVIWAASIYWVRAVFWACSEEFYDFMIPFLICYYYSSFQMGKVIQSINHKPGFRVREIDPRAGTPRLPCSDASAVEGSSLRRVGVQPLLSETRRTLESFDPIAK